MNLTVSDSGAKAGSSQALSTEVARIYDPKLVVPFLTFCEGRAAPKRPLNPALSCQHTETLGWRLYGSLNVRRALPETPPLRSPPRSGIKDKPSRAVWQAGLI
jgi:hypothetical protein